MQTSFTKKHLGTDSGKRAEEILRKCVHCGFCTATCPTYQLTGDELDGPRGRIYQIKSLFEGEAADQKTQYHLDRCLTCRSCETTCPSGVNYAELLDLGRVEVEKQVTRSKSEQISIKLLNLFLPYPLRHSFGFKSLSLLKPMFPNLIGQKIPKIRALSSKTFIQRQNFKTVYLLEGCVQSTISPNTNHATEHVLSALGYQVIREQQAKCCGALSQHTHQHKRAKSLILSQLEAWQLIHNKTPLAAIVSTASGCGVMLKDYSRLITQKQRELYADVLDKIVDVSELMDAKTLKPLLKARLEVLAFHAPCTLNHGQKLSSNLKNNLSDLGYQLKEPKNSHICCGSAGAYSILQADLSKQLQKNKVDALEQTKADLIITANVGCEHHLDSVSHLKVKHWIEIISEDLK